ncbi:hypothetical protein VTK56DRAFT_4509 [Thermocarpiscus australiensis]
MHRRKCHSTYPIQVLALRPRLACPAQDRRLLSLVERFKEAQIGFAKRYIASSTTPLKQYVTSDQMTAPRFLSKQLLL